MKKAPLLSHSLSKGSEGELPEQNGTGMFAQGTDGPEIRFRSDQVQSMKQTYCGSFTLHPSSKTNQKKTHKKIPGQKLMTKPILCQTHCSNCSNTEPFAHLMPEVTIHPACPLQPTTKSWQAAPQLCFCTFQHYSAPSCNHLLIFPGCPV